MSTIRRNNNPGAIEDGPFARSMPGYQPGGGRFAKFATEADGIRAQERLLSGKSYRGKSPAQIVMRYAPPGDNGGDNIANYIHYIATGVGLKPDQPVPPEKIPVFARAMREFETGVRRQGYKPATDQDRQFIRGIAGLSSRGGGKVTTTAKRNDFADGILEGLTVKPQPYVVSEPTAGEKADVADGKNPATDIATAPDHAVVRDKTNQAVTANDKYTEFLSGTVEHVVAQGHAITSSLTQQAQIKQNIAEDIQTRALALEERIKPLQERRTRLIERMREMESMSPLEKSLKGMFNADYNEKVIRGKLERVDQIIALEGENYKELNELRTGVAGMLVDAENADQQVASSAIRSLTAEAQLRGTVAGALGENAKIQLLPLEMQNAVTRQELTQKDALVGNATTEMVTSWYNQAAASPDGTITVDGVKLTVGELQEAAKESQGKDMQFETLKDAFALGKMRNFDYIESQFIDRMTPEELQEALKNGGNYKGQQLSLGKLTQAAQLAAAGRDDRVNNAILSTTEGMADATVGAIADQMRATGPRTVEMFGNQPPRLLAIGASIVAEKKVWESGRLVARQQGVEAEYIAKTLPQVNSWAKRFDDGVEEVANTWGGGKGELKAVASAYLRGQPLSGEAAVAGLITMARSGMPAGAKITGPALAAIEAARAVVQEADNPQAQAGSDIASLMQGTAKVTPEQLKRRVQQAVEGVYADGITNELMTALPNIARQVGDPNRPGQMHPFARVSQQDFQAAIRHGDSEGFEAIGRELGISPQAVQQMFKGGVGSSIWQAAKKAKGLSDGQFNDYMAKAQAVQMAGTLAALDASGSASPGFSPAAAFVDLLNQPATMNKVDEMVNGYGRSNFGAFLVSSSAGGGYRAAWQSYTQGVAATQQSLQATTLRQRIQQQRSMFGDPFTRMDAVLAASQLTPQERQVLVGATRGLVKAPNIPQHVIMGDRGMTGLGGAQRKGFDDLTYVIKNHKFEDPAIERIRQKASKNWDEMDAVIQRLAEGNQ